MLSGDLSGMSRNPFLVDRKMWFPEQICLAQENPSGASLGISPQLASTSPYISVSMLNL